MSAVYCGTDYSGVKQWYAVREIRYSAKGFPFEVVNFMPRMPDSYLNSVFYLYKSVKAAGQGEAAGGTGFIVGYSSRHEGYLYFYAITNAHVVREYGSPVVRLNLKEGGADSIPFKSTDWITRPEDDLAITWIGGADFKKYDTSYIHAQTQFASKDHVVNYDIGIGDDVTTIGRFISHDGGLINKPSIRFGSISMMPTVINFQGREQECYLVEVRSLRGSSGSPVFVYIDNPQRRRLMVTPDLVDIPRENTWLLGIAFADVPYEEEVLKRVFDADGTESVEATPYYALSNSGQMAVIPAWRLYDFLTTDERLVMSREEGDKAMDKIKAESPLRPTGQKPQESSDITQEGFMDALRRASQKISSPDEEKNET